MTSVLMHCRRLSLLLLLLVSGCSIADTSGGVTYQVPISGGGTAPVEINRGIVINTENEDARIEKTIFNVNLERYEFEFFEKKGAVPRHVTVEDVTDPQAVTLVDDDHPQLTGGHWAMNSPQLEYDDRSLKWIHEIDPSLRVYKFRIEQPDGTVLVMYEPQLYPDAIKELIRKKMEPPVPAAG